MKLTNQKQYKLAVSIKVRTKIQKKSQLMSRCQSSIHLSKKPLITHQPSLAQYSSQPLLCKISVNSSNKLYYLDVYVDSTIKGLANQLIQMLGIDQDVDEEVREQLGLMLVKQIQITINKQQLNYLSRCQLQNIIKHYFYQKSSNDQFASQQSTDSMRYFKQNYIQSNHKHNKSSQKLNHSNLYQKAQKSLQKKLLIQKQHKQQKDQQQKKLCTFKPKIIQKISKSHKDKNNNNNSINNTNKSLINNKSLSKQKKCVFMRLYQDAQQMQAKKHYKHSQQKTQINNQQNKQCSFIPQINKCSKQIMKLKLMDLQPTGSIIFNQSFKQNVLNNHYSKNYVIQQLVDPCFYQNRFNKTLQKHNKENLYTFHPQLSEGTKRITQQYPKFQKRLAMQDSKRQEKQKTTKKNKQTIASQSFCSDSNQKSFKKPKNTQSSQKKYLLRMNTQVQNFKKIKNFNNKEYNKNNKYEYNSISNRNDVKHQAKQAQTLKPKGTKPQKLSLHFFPQQFNQTITPQKPTKPTPFQKALSSFTQKQSLLNQNKSIIFSNLFDYLTKNKQITWIDLDRTKIMTKQVKQIIRPLVLELKNMDTTLDKEEFGWSLQNLYQELNHLQREIFIQWAGNVNHYYQPKKYINYDQLKHVKTQDSVFQLIQ